MSTKYIDCCRYTATSWTLQKNAFFPTPKNYAMYCSFIHVLLNSMYGRF